MTLSESGGEVTALLKRLSEGDQAAQDDLYPLVYQELRRLASSHLRREGPGHTLQPTALLHEAYLKLVQLREIDWASRGHFFSISARIMRQLLISHARAKLSGKRGGSWKRLDLDSGFVHAPDQDPLLLALHESLARLEKESVRAYRLVELKFFAGYDFEEAALALGVSSRTLKRDWEMAKRWLYRDLRQQQEQAGSE